MRISKFTFKFSLISLILVAVLCVFGLIAATTAYFYYADDLPNVNALAHVQYRQPLRIYTRDGKLMAKYGTVSREPLDFNQFPPLLVQAFLGAEDNDFYNEPGVDWKGLLRAAVSLVLTGDKSQGGSTITMQVARNFFLSNAKTYSRKFKEIILAYRLNKAFSKHKILQLYLNKIYLGKGAYGVAAAAKVYYGKNLHDLNLSQIAMLAGLPQAPSAHNPIDAPGPAKQRRNYVLRRMYELNYIDKKQYIRAEQQPVSAHVQSAPDRVEADYVAEMIRSRMVDRYGRKAYTGGYTVVSTIESRYQGEAVRALRDDLLAYEYRHGYHGPEAHIDLKKASTPEAWNDHLSARGPAGSLVAAVVLSVGKKSAEVYTRDQGKFRLDWKAMSWARRYKGAYEMGPKPEIASDVVSPGDVIRLASTGDEKHPWKVANVPVVEGTLVALNPANGGIVALVGGFDFQQSQFNRAVQARRQPGSSFKPFVYSAALHHGLTPATMINDAPVVYDQPGIKQDWRPENYERKFNGPTRLRIGLVHSLNLVTVRIVRDIGLDFTRDYATRFGLPKNQLPDNLSMALGSGSFSPLQMVRGYTVFANGGYLVDPYYIRKVTGPSGAVLYRSKPTLACKKCASGQRATNAPRVISPQNAYIMTSMLHDVIQHGTGRAARALGRHDLSGKTGTTNDQVDAWFSGFNSNLATTVWVGFDKPAPLGWGETGAHAALPAWQQFMGAALKGTPEATMPRPSGLVTVRINPKTGKLAASGEQDAVFETFRKGHVPPPARTRAANEDNSGSQGGWVQQLY